MSYIKGNILSSYASNRLGNCSRHLCTYATGVATLQRDMPNWIFGIKKAKRTAGLLQK